MIPFLLLFEIISNEYPDILYIIIPQPYSIAFFNLFFIEV